MTDSLLNAPFDPSLDADDQPPENGLLGRAFGDMRNRHRRLRPGEALPPIPTLYRQLEMLCRTREAAPQPAP